MRISRGARGVAALDLVDHLVDVGSREVVPGGGTDGAHALAAGALFAVNYRLFTRGYRLRA
jgi:hypothetical protein